MRKICLLAFFVIAVLSVPSPDTLAADYQYLGDFCWAMMPSNAGSTGTPGFLLGLRAGLFYMGSTHVTLGGTCGYGEAGDPQSSLIWLPCMGNLELVGNSLLGTVTGALFGAGKVQGELVMDLGTLNGIYHTILLAGSSQKAFASGVLQTIPCGAQ